MKKTIFYQVRFFFFKNYIYNIRRKLHIEYSSQKNVSSLPKGLQSNQPLYNPNCNFSGFSARLGKCPRSSD